MVSSIHIILSRQRRWPTVACENTTYRQNFDDTCILDSYMYFRGLTPSLAPVNCICPLPVGQYLCILHLFTNKMTCKHYQHKLQYWLATTSQHVNIMEFLPSPPTFSQNRALYTPGG